MAPRHPNRPQYRTLLLVGEGETEQAFLQHVKALYVQRGSGLRVTVRCAHGKGAGHVVDYAIRQRIHQFDQVAALLDPRHYAAHFGADALQVGRKIEPTLDDLLRLLAA